MAELKKIVFKNKDVADPNFPQGYEPISAENLNLFQDNIEEAINEETKAMNETVTNTLTQFDTESDEKLNDIQIQADKKIEEMNNSFENWFANLKNQLDNNQATNLQNQIDKINEKLEKAVYFEEVETIEE